MVREQLADAADHLTAASDIAGDEAASERLTELAEQLERLSTADRGPDHGRMARIQSALADLQDEVGSDAAADIEAADDAINAYRETVQGV